MVHDISDVTRSILVVAAHPDDEVLGCGGFLARQASAGAHVRVLLLGDGVSSRSVEGESAQDGPAVLRREKEAQEAARILGVEELFFSRFPDNRFDTVPLLDLVRTIEEHVADQRPQWVLTHHSGDLNIDHRRTHEAVLTACRPLPGGPKKLLTFEIPSSTEWRFGRPGDAFLPNFFVDIENHLERKLEALSAYASELRPFPHPCSPEAIKAIAHRWGSVVGCKAAEAYVTLREII